MEELRAAVAGPTSSSCVWLTSWARVDLAVALHRRERPGDPSRLARRSPRAGRSPSATDAPIVEHADRAGAELDGRRAAG